MLGISVLLLISTAVNSSDMELLDPPHSDIIDQGDTWHNNSDVDESGESEDILRFEDLIKVKLGTFKETRPHPNVQQ